MNAKDIKTLHCDITKLVEKYARDRQDQIEIICKRMENIILGPTLPLKKISLVVKNGDLWYTELMNVDHDIISAPEDFINSLLATIWKIAGLPDSD